MSEHPQSSFHDPLSIAGRQRRDAMLGVLVGEMQSLHRRRRTRRHILASSMLVLAVVGLSVVIQSTRRSTSHDLAPVQVAKEIPNAAVRSNIEFVKTDESLVDRLRSTSISRADWLNDQSLLTALSDAGRPSGLIHAEGRTWLTSNVVDPIVQPTGGM